MREAKPACSGSGRARRNSPAATAHRAPIRLPNPARPLPPTAPASAADCRWSCAGGVVGCRWGGPQAYGKAQQQGKASLLQTMIALVNGGTLDLVPGISRSMV